jgi:hypothetical protein
MKRDKHQRIAYAILRSSLAVDRVIRATTQSEKDRAGVWTRLWAAAYGNRGKS